MASLLDRHLKIPRYLQIAEGLRRQIESGALAPGDRVPSFIRLRREYGVTQSTVEKVFGVLEKEGLIVREPSRGTFVAPVPGEANRTRTGIIGVSGSGFSMDAYSTYWTQILHGMHGAARRAGVQILLLDHESNEGWEKADGVILCDWLTIYIWQRATAGQPRVALLLEREGTPSVRADDTQGGRLATEHLLALGHRRIAFLHSQDDIRRPMSGEAAAHNAGREALRRLEGYDEALRTAGIAPNAAWRRPLTGIYSSSEEFVTTGHLSMRKWLQTTWSDLGCTAILVHNDEAAIGVMRALAEAGLRVPEDISVVGFDGTDVCQRITPNLTTISVPLEEIGARSVELMLAQIAGDTEFQPCDVLPVELKIQGSTAPPLSLVAKSPNLKNEEANEVQLGENV